MSSLEELMGELCSGDDERANAVLPQIYELGAESVKALEVLIESDDADERWWAVRAIAGIGNENSTELLIKGLKDKDTAVQQCAALGLRERPNPSAIPDLIPILNDKDRMLARLAGDALARYEHAATNALMDVAKFGELSGRVEAVRALALIGDYASVSTLFKLLDDESALIEHWAQEGLQRMGIGMMFFKPG